MGSHLIVGAGGIGRATAAGMITAGDEVLVVSRSGPRDLPEGAQGRAIDIADTDALTALAQGRDSIVNAANPSRYWRWEQEWPVMASSLLTAAERSGAGLVTIGNLYGYGRVDAPMTEQTPVRPNGRKGAVRAAMWRDALAAHEAGRCRATELRASDYVGPEAGAGVSFVNEYVVGPAAAGKPVRVPMGRVDVPHSITYLADIGTLAARLARGGGWGRVWHVPTGPALTLRQVALDAARLAGQPEPSVRAYPRLVVTAGGVFSPLLRELWETRHQFERPFVLDSTAATTEFGLNPTPWETQLGETIAWLRRAG